MFLALNSCSANLLLAGPNCTHQLLQNYALGHKKNKWGRENRHLQRRQRFVNLCRDSKDKEMGRGNLKCGPVAFTHFLSTETAKSKLAKNAKCDLIKFCSHSNSTFP